MTHWNQHLGILGSAPFTRSEPLHKIVHPRLHKSQIKSEFIHQQHNGLTHLQTMSYPQDGGSGNGTLVLRQRPFEAYSQNSFYESFGGQFCTNPGGMSFENHNQMSVAAKMADNVLKEYRTLDCSCCNQFFGYMHRKTGELYCRGACLPEPSKESCTGSMPLGPTFVPTAPLTQQQFIALNSHSGAGAHIPLVGEIEIGDLLENGKILRENLLSRSNSNNSNRTITDEKPDPFKHRGARSNTKENDQNQRPREETMRGQSGFPSKSDTTDKGVPLQTNVSYRHNVNSTPTVVSTRTVEGKLNPFQNGAPAPRPTTKANGQRPYSVEDRVDGDPSQNKNVSARSNGTASAISNRAMEGKPNPFQNATTIGSPRPTTKDDNSNLKNRISSQQPTVTPPPETPPPETPPPETPRPPVEKPQPRWKEILITPNPTMLKCRSALPWPFEADNSMGIALLGLKCNDNGPNDFAFQSHAMAKKLEMLQQDILNFTSAAVGTPLKRLELGTLVFAPFANEVFRGEIIGIPRVDVAEVYFIDYGNTMDIALSDLSILPQQFKKVPRLCIHCQWDFWLNRDESDPVSDSVTNTYHSTDTEGVIPVLKIGDGQYLVAILTKIENVVYSVTPYHIATKVPVGIEEQKPKVEEVEEVEEEEECVNPFTKIKPQTNETKPPEKQKTAEPQRRKFMFSELDYSPELIDGSIVKVSFVWGLTKYMIASPADEENSIKMQEELNTSLDSARLFKCLPDIHEIVLAPYLGEYYRGRVVEYDRDDKSQVKVIFIDFGDQSSMKFSDLYAPTESIMKHPIYAMNITIFGLVEPEGKVDLGDEVKEFLSSSLQLQIMQKPAQDSDSDIHSVVLWNGNNTLNKELKRNFEIANAQETKSYLDHISLYDSYAVSILKSCEIEQTKMMTRENEKYIWTPLDLTFDYFINDIPWRCLQGVVQVKIVRYWRLDSIEVIPIGQKFTEITNFLSKDIEDYVQTVEWDENFKPAKGQVCLAKMPSWGEYAKNLQLYLPEKAFKNLKLHRDHLAERTQAGKWFRALYMSDHEGDLKWFNFFDVGRKLCVEKTNVYKAPLRFMLAPMMNTRLVVVWLEMAQLTRNWNLVMETVLTEGTTLEVRVIEEYESMTMARLISPNEKELLQKALMLNEDGKKKQEKLILQAQKSKKKPIVNEYIPRTFEPAGLVPERYSITMVETDEEEERAEDDMNAKWLRLRSRNKTN